jgi:hypothetical protein
MKLKKMGLVRHRDIPDNEPGLSLEELKELGLENDSWFNPEPISIIDIFVFLGEIKNKLLKGLGIFIRLDDAKVFLRGIDKFENVED